VEHVQWNLPASVGILQVDEQHRELHGLLLKLFGTLATDPNGALSEFRFIRLVEQTTLHFLAEEECLRSLGYPDLGTHRGDHEKLLVRVRGNLIRWNGPGAPLLFDLVEDFAASIQRHMDTVDQAFAQWFEQEASMQIRTSWTATSPPPPSTRQ